MQTSANTDIAISKPTPLEPVRDYLLVLPFEESDTIGGIYVPASAKRQLTQGQVLKVGEDVTRIKPGEIVIWDLHTDSVLTHDRVKYSLIREEFIIAKMNVKDVEVSE